MKKLFGNKIVSIVLAFSFLCGASLWAQSADDDFDDFDDFDSIFEDAADDIEVEQTDPVTVTAAAPASAPPRRWSG